MLLKLLAPKKKKKLWWFPPSPPIVITFFFFFVGGNIFALRGGGEGGCAFFSYIYIYFLIIYKCCKHLLAISKVLEALEHPFQSYGAFYSCNFTYLHSKLEETLTEKANGKSTFCGAIKWPPLIPGSSSATERYANFLLSHFLAFAQWPWIYSSSAHTAFPVASRSIFF